MSRTRRVELLGNALMFLFQVGTIARFDVTAASSAFSDDTVGWLCPCGHNVRYPSPCRDHCRTEHKRLRPGRDPAIFARRHIPPCAPWLSPQNDNVLFA